MAKTLKNKDSINKAKNFGKSLKKLIDYMGKYRIIVILVLIFAIVSTAFSVAGPKVMGEATTELAKGIMAKIRGTGGIDFSVIGHILLITLILYLVSAVFAFVQGWLMTSVTQKVCYNLRREISEKIGRLPMEYFESRTLGDVLSRITNDVDTLGTGLNQSITQLITSISTIIGVVIMMLWISPLMTLIAMVILPLSILLMSIMVKFSQKYFKQQQDYLGKINGMVEESYSGQLVIAAFNKEEDVIDDFEKTSNILYKSAQKSQFFSGLMRPLMIFVGNMGYGAVTIAGGLLATKGVIGIGDIQAFIQYVKSFTQPLQQIAQVINQVQSTAAAAERIFDFLEAEEEETTEDKVGENVEIKGAVEFKGVEFGYKPDQIIIKDFSTKVNPGEKIAIVGPTGAGKTTVVKLLMRFYDVNKGSITLDGYDLRDFNRHHLREYYGMVLQDTWLFNGTIMENIRYGKIGASDEDVIEAAKAAHAHHFITTLPEGYNTVINEEASNISQGQKQLLTIARAILADNRVMILDEATSSVDTRTEEIIQLAMDKLMEGRTSFVIAHRLSTIKNADKILVMKDGDIIEQGNHETLLAKKGFYYNLYNSQFEE